MKVKFSPRFSFIVGILLCTLAVHAADPRTNSWFTTYAGSYARMLAEHMPLDGEVPITEEELSKTLANIRQQGYLERDSAQSFGVVDISFPILGPDNMALATLTCPYIQRIDRHVGPSLLDVRTALREAAQTLSFTQGMAAGRT